MTKTTKPITEAAAWREAAEFFAEPNAHSALRLYICNYLDNNDGSTWNGGLDWAPVERWPRGAMLARISEHVAMSGYDELKVLQDGRADNSARVIFCLLMAYECEQAE